MALALVTAAVVAACGGNSGIDRFEGGGMVVEYPASWEPLDTDQADLEGLVFAADGPKDARGGGPRLSMFNVERSSETIRQFGKSIAGRRPFEYNEGRAAGDGPIEVPGADGAWRVATRFAAKRPDGSETSARVVELLAIKGDREYGLTVAGVEEAMDRPEIDAIMRSWRLEG